MFKSIPRSDANFLARGEAFTLPSDGTTIGAAGAGVATGAAGAGASLT